jgi:hypothetical protein
MAIVLEANYAKKLGLPNFSSHQYSVTIRTELTDLSQVEEASTRLYGLLQDAVDRKIQNVGFMPDASTYGMNNGANQNGDQRQNGHAAGRANGNHRENGGTRDPSAWRCSEKQRELIERFVREKGLEKNAVESLAVEMFGAGVKQLDRLQASGLIDELFDRHGGGRRNGKRPYRRERLPAGGGGDR